MKETMVDVLESKMRSKYKSNPHFCAILLLLCLFLCGMGVHSDEHVDPRKLPADPGNRPRNPVGPNRPKTSRIAARGSAYTRPCNERYYCH